jgi:hypothetical protein
MNFNFDEHNRARIWARLRIRHGSGWTVTKKPASAMGGGTEPKKWAAGNSWRSWPPPSDWTMQHERALLDCCQRTDTRWEQGSKITWKTRKVRQLLLVFGQTKWNHGSTKQYKRRVTIEPLCAWVRSTVMTLNALDTAPTKTTLLLLLLLLPCMGS